MIKLFIISLYFISTLCESVSPKFSRVWGPGLHPKEIIMPARYFFIEARDFNDRRLNSSVGDDAFKVILEGTKGKNKPCRIYTNIMNRKEGSYIVRYKLFDKCDQLKITIKHFGDHVAESPYDFHGAIFPDHCDCPEGTLSMLLEKWACGSIPKQIYGDLSQFGSIDWNVIRSKIVEKYDKPYSISLCHYVIKSNQIYRKCYGQYVGFKMFMDSILLSLARKTVIPDVEFFVNLGDWPLVSKDINKPFPVFSWCGSRDTFDIIMPTYDITESTLENMGRVTLDMLSVQGNSWHPWNARHPQVFWRGRDSSRERLKLIEISRNNPDLFNCSLTNFFFFKDEEKIYGPKAEHVSFFKFFEYKYQISLDGTVAAYRLPYLLAGGSLIFKQDSKYNEHFYNTLEPYVHYVPIKKNLEDLVSKIKWAIENDDKAKTIAENARQFSNEHLLPKNIFCYYSQLLTEFSKRIVSPIVVLENMEKVEQPQLKDTCDCSSFSKDEL